MPINWLQVVAYANDVILTEQPESFVKFADIIIELQVSIQHDDFVHGVRHYFVQTNRDKEQSIIIVGSRFVTEVILHGLDDLMRLFCQIVHIQVDNL